MTRLLVIGAGIGGLTAAVILAERGYQVTVLEAQAYAGGCAGTFYHQGYRFDAGATVAGGFQDNGAHQLLAKRLGIRWPVKQHEPAWMVHLPDRTVAMTADYRDVMAKFPDSENFWHEQRAIADIGWKLAAQGLPWPPQDFAEFSQLIKLGIGNFPDALRMIPFALSTVQDWVSRKGLGKNREFLRFLDASLLISAQNSSAFVNSAYGATALDLPRQGVYHVEGGMGGIAETLVNTLHEMGGEILFKQHVRRIAVEAGRVTGVYASKGRRATKESFYPADFVLANTTPWGLNKLLGDDSPLKHEIRQRKATQGAFVLHLGIDAQSLPVIAEHHQIVRSYEGKMGECQSIFLSISPEWDTSRAPAGQRAVTVSTHTNVAQWWDLLESDAGAYQAKKQAYMEQMTETIDGVLAGFKGAIRFAMAGSPVTYEFYTLRPQGMVGGFPQSSLFKVRSPKTGISNLRLVGDSIFPGQSTAAVTLGGMRVAADVIRKMPLSRPHYSMAKRQS